MDVMMMNMMLCNFIIYLGEKGDVLSGPEKT